MSDLIRKEDVKKFVCKNCVCKHLDEPCDGDCAMLRSVDNIPSLETPFLYGEEVEEVERALGKQKPLIPFHTINQYGLKVWRCGSCENGIDKKMKYCYQCGNKIKWEVNDDD